MGRKFGYIRSVRSDRSLNRQVNMINKEYPNAVIFKEISEKPADGWKRLIKEVKSGDTIIVDSVTKLGNTASHAVNTYFELYQDNIQLVFIREHHIDTSVYNIDIDNASSHTKALIGEYIKLLIQKQVKITFEQSQEMILDSSKKIKEGIDVARNNGAKVGLTKGIKLITKKSISAKEIILRESKDFNGTRSDSEVIKLAGISRNTYYSYKKELKIKNNQNNITNCP